jgi:RecA/RadA recombinase
MEMLHDINLSKRYVKPGLDEKFNGDATQAKVIKALCKADFRTQAVAVFKDELVKFVVPI